MSEVSNSSQNPEVVIVESPPATPSSGRKHHRFSLEDDLAILRELASHIRTFQYGSKAWEEIAGRMTGRLAGVKGRSVRERVLHLVQLHMKGQATSLKQ